MAVETIDDILREMKAKAATLCRKGHLGAAEEWWDMTNRIAKVRAAELERFRQYLNFYGSQYKHVQDMLALIDKAQEQANG